MEHDGQVSVRNPDWKELMDRQEWCGPERLGMANPPGKGGTYVIQVYAGTTPRAVRRANGDDVLGVLLIGESINLARRINTMRSAMQLLDDKRSFSHRPGLEYSKGWGYDFARAFEYTTLNVRYWMTRSHAVLEATLLERYRWEYLDRPPLKLLERQMAELQAQ